MRADVAASTALLLLGTACFGGGSPPPPDYLQDKVVSERVLSVLRRTEGEPFADVRVQTRNGVVTLSGQVATPAAKTRAEQLARRVAGANEVVNRIVVAGKGS